MTPFTQLELFMTQVLNSKLNQLTTKILTVTKLKFITHLKTDIHNFVHFQIQYNA